MGGNPFCEWCGEEKDSEPEDINGKSICLCWDCHRSWIERHEEPPCENTSLPPVK
jgi:hypothetical protein